VGVRELRQNLSVYLKRVAAGEAFDVTERGRTVAILAPHPQMGDKVDQLVAAGLARPAIGDLLDLPPLKRPLRRRHPPISISEASREQRADRF
jgi:antitoxin (DNA-binding transcriptional repressor) of toxin-antitoxin stability system